jgi:hypothetical protein
VSVQAYRNVDRLVREARAKGQDDREAVLWCALDAVWDAMSEPERDQVRVRLEAA